MNPLDESTGLPPVRLRDARGDDAELLRGLNSPAVLGEWDHFDDPGDEMLSGALYNGATKIVELPDGSAIGSVSWIQVPYGPNQRSLAWSIGITVLPVFRGRGLGASAQRRLALELLGRSHANRVQADTDIGNVAEQRSLQLAGFTREGIARGAQWRRGRWHDRVLYSLLRGDVAPDTSRLGGPVTGGPVTG